MIHLNSFIKTGVKRWETIARRIGSIASLKNWTIAARLIIAGMSPESSDFLIKVLRGLINTGKQFLGKTMVIPLGPAEELTDISLSAETICSSSILMPVSKGLSSML